MSDIGIKELAKSLGISTASVSRALSNPDRVSKKMRDRVQAAAKKAGYTQNSAAASLRTSKTDSIVAIIPDISDPFVSGVIRSLERTAAKHGYSVLIGDTEGLRARELVYGDMVRSRKVDGIICFSHRLPFPDDDLLNSEASLPPIVNSCEIITGQDELGINIPWVSIDNIAAAKEATHHLLSLGHKDIAVITGHTYTPSTQHRLLGYQQALAEKGVPFNESLIYEGCYTLEAGEQCTLEIFGNYTAAQASG